MLMTRMDIMEYEIINDGRGKTKCGGKNLNGIGLFARLVAIGWC
jgi:hypothetical protein